LKKPLNNVEELHLAVLLLELQQALLAEKFQVSMVLGFHFFFQ
jgi:hypothetical protein